MKYPSGITVCGGISGFGKTELLFLDLSTRINSEFYINQILPNYETHFLQFNLPYFAQDGARSHTANKTKQHLEIATPGEVFEWPGNSPDLNPSKLLLT